jgi:D-alanyl-lipoteichoic acid acyltransferase DltB (MBOAT superfamily)
MLFNSIEFFFFFSFVVLIYFLLPHKFRWLFLLAASYYFYACFKVEYLCFIIITTVSSFLTARLIFSDPSPRKKQFWLMLNIALNLGILFVFKYYDFVVLNLGRILNPLNWGNLTVLNLILPVGISFYTFQAIGYTFDVYYESRDPEKHFGVYALYISFFPKLVAGPIERSTNLLPQFKKEVYFDYERTADGLRLVLWGLFKKIAIADRLTIMVDPVFSDPTRFEGVSLIIATVLYAFQVFCDFSAYSDIAIGISRILGFNLVENFNRPYSSKSISEYWRRWHMSLIKWFNDYVYTPVWVKLKKWGRTGIMLSIAITFILSGLWHGAAWTYIIWGALQAVAISYETITKKKRQQILKKLPQRLSSSVCLLATFSFICFTDIFFRSNSISDAFCFITRIFSGFGNSMNDILLNHDYARQKTLYLNQDFSFFLTSLLLIVFLQFVHFVQKDGKIERVLYGKPAWLRLGVYYFLLWGLFYLGTNGNQQFIYFQF